MSYIHKLDQYIRHLYEHKETQDDSAIKRPKLHRRNTCEWILDKDLDEITLSPSNSYMDFVPKDSLKDHFEENNTRK